ncbi:MAG: PEP-CTERM sorting domain-containing protein [Casimicrobiaceae bacterium]
MSLGIFSVPSVAGANETLSFLGILFSEGAVVSRVRIISSNQVLAAGHTTEDLVALDDFIYGEPRIAQQIPEPATLLLVALSLFALGAFRLRAAVPVSEAISRIAKQRVEGRQRKRAFV